MKYLATGFPMGFPSHHKVPQFSCHSKNLLSAMEIPNAMDAKLSKELDAHRLAGFKVLKMVMYASRHISTGRNQSAIARMHYMNYSE